MFARTLVWMVLLLPCAARAEFRVLFIGNSFTIGSGGGGVPGIFDRLVQAGGHDDPTTVMRAVGGADYQYHSQDATTLAIINSQPWTHVILQNYSTEPTHLGDGVQGIADHMSYGTELYRQIMNNNPQTRVILFETWSRAEAHSLITGVSGSTSFASTDEFQAELRTNYHRLADSLNASYPTNPPVLVAPVGDAWQNAGGLLPISDPRFVSLHGSDNYHGNNNGYYLAAAVFYSVIYGVSPHGLSAHPLVSGLNLGFTEDPIMLEDVAWATVSPSIQPTVQTVLFDFGATANTTDRGLAPDDPVNCWNNVTADIGSSDTAELPNLVNSANIGTGISLVMLNRFNGANGNGTQDPAAPYAMEAVRDSLFGNTELFSGLSNIFPRFKLTGLNPALTYNFSFYASRTGVTDNRETSYTVQGGSSGVVALNAANNVTNEVTLAGISPDSLGEITIRLAPTANNNNANHFTYVGVMKMVGMPPQEPVAFTSEPVSQTVTEFESVTFTATVQGTAPYFAQWLSNDVPIPGATQFAYEIPLARSDMDGSRFSVTVSNLSSIAASSNAVLRVVADTNPPVLLSADSEDGVTIHLGFDERLDPVTVTNASSYTVNGGAVTVLTAGLQPDGKTVALTMGAQVEGGFTVLVNGITDLAGNPLAANTTATGQVPDPATESLLFDFGGGSTTERGASPDDPVNYWNNVTAGIGASSTGQLLNLVTMRNTPTGIGLVMLGRFNGANENGTTATAPFPTDATRDSLYGNTEIWNGLTDIFPSFKLTGLDPTLAYHFTFYASRTGVSDNRETAYIVQGTDSALATLNPVNNITNSVTVAGMTPDASGQITVSLAATVNNNNAYHFTYLGVMRVDPVRVDSGFLAPVLNEGQITLDWTGSGQLEWARTVLGPWTPVTPAPVPPYSERVVPGDNRFFRLKTNP